MQVLFITETTKFNFLKMLFKKIEIKQDMIFFNFKLQKMKLVKKIKIVKKLKKIVCKDNKIIISKNLKQDKEFVDLLNSNEFNIVDGKQLFKRLIVDFIDFICKDNKIKPEEMQIGITINDINTLNLESIEKLAKKFKSINIVTNNINSFKNLKEYLWIENGIIINLTNNKKKALIKSHIILNVDFPEEVLNKYCIYDNGILINLEEIVKIKKKRFCGKILNDYKIKFKKGSNIKKVLENERFQDFDLNDLAEIYLKNSPNEIEDIIICK